MQRINAAAVLPVFALWAILGAFFQPAVFAGDDADLDGWTIEEGDCDDTNDGVYPDAVETCDGIDNDCDGTADDGGDEDGDGYSRCFYANPEGVGSDCDDYNDGVYPGAAETCDGLDNDCDYEADEASDADGDGYTIDCDGEVQSSEDCNDADPAIHPGAAETCDGVDNDCDGEIDEAGGGSTERFYRDADADGYGDERSTVDACREPEGYVDNADDCDDTDPEVNPDAVEACDGVDNDCDGETDEDLPTSVQYVDEDGDGFGDPESPVAVCDGNQGLVVVVSVDNADDCDDADPSVNPEAEEVCDGVDNDCDGEIDEVGGRDVYIDGDRDGYGSEQVQTCESPLPSGYVVAGGDCDDDDIAIHPGAVETCDGLDNDCNGDVDDGLTSCEPPTDTPSPTPTPTASPAPDGGLDSPGDNDARDPSKNGGGCSCSSASSQPSGWAVFFFLGVVVIRTRKRL